MLISSVSNNRIKAIRSLHQRKAREQSGLCFIDGFHQVRAACDSDAVLETLVVCPERLVRDNIWEWFELQRMKATPVLEVAGPVFDTLATKNAEQGIGAVVRQEWHSLEDLCPAPTKCYIALEAIQYPGNLGTILRTADAVGANGIVLLDNATDPYDPQSLRASKGAVFTQRLVRTRSADFAAWVRQEGLRVVGAVPEAPTDFRHLTCPTPLVLLLGSERDGLSPALGRLCDCTVRIPMRGQCDSLNIAIACGILLYSLLGAQIA